MSSHSRYAHRSNPSALPAPTGESRRVSLYLIVSIVLGLLFIVVAESHARHVEHLRTVGVSVEGAVTSLDIQQRGGRSASTFWVNGEYRAVSPSGRELTLPFRFAVTEQQYQALDVGAPFALVYDPESLREPQPAVEIEAYDTNGIRLAAVGAAGVYVLIALALGAYERRQRGRATPDTKDLRRAFGSR